ncbi:TetR/AcrR family transcriptional regulator [Streptomyces rhizosphaericus]|uniref:TetR family transcriptional regulator n=1 Tax=Streptomyces rhizosphaericus TaxID=114699 RepID=A0A6G4ATE8_9ACTN|nr:TetR/AcrR family transcriptional regulator [Streptomyces rhizosphaericus]NEW76528.1 TetR family transcriptional regulator [Streptomyces rhizosphaericus]
MGRWPTGAQERLQEAAIELFTERGYERTTVAEIAKRAGLTERTFYNHFADKREVLFPDQGRFIAEVCEAVGAAPAEQSPLDAVLAAFTATSDWFDQRRDASQRRRHILDAHTDLRERERAKMAALGEAIADALRTRGISEPAATLTATVSVAAYQLASARWLADPQHATLGHHLHTSFDDLHRTARTW